MYVPSTSLQNTILTPPGNRRNQPSPCFRKYRLRVNRPGRWGSSDTALGIPVKWPQISGARLIVESALKNYRIEPSQGTHFFQNLTSMGVGYFTIDPTTHEGFYDVDYLNSLPATYESDAVRIVTFPECLTIGINGKKEKV